jgi:hypothetical protein
MVDGESRAPFYESRWFKGSAAVVALAVSVAALVGPLGGLIGDLFSSEHPRINTEIVMDSSAAMEDRLGPSPITKLDGAKGAIADYARPFADQGLALRAFGGCDQTGQLLVDFGSNHGDDVAEAAARQQAHGGADLGDAVRAAIDDFTDLPSDTTKRVVVFAGAVDQCGGASATARDISDFLNGTGVSAEFRLVGVDVSARDKAQLETLKRALGKAAETDYAYTPPELRRVVNQLPGELPPTTGSTGPRSELTAP